MPRTAVFAALLLILAAGTASAQQSSKVASLVRGAAPEVRAALDSAETAETQQALETIVANGAISVSLLEQALAKPLFAKQIHDTLTALAKVDRVPGAKRTLERVLAANDESGVRGAAFEIQVAASVGAEKLAGIGVNIDGGHETDLLLKDGTRVEVKSQQDESTALADRVVTKATDQLKKRGSFGNPVMLITNRPIDKANLDYFRREVGPASSAFQFKDGQLIQLLAPGPETEAERTKRISDGEARLRQWRGQNGQRSNRNGSRGFRRTSQRAVRMRAMQNGRSGRGARAQRSARARRNAGRFGSRARR